ncbi:Homeobox protein onecut [Hypsibius exemplaris]|uniref:One cut domain family member n=1 Tax=Hypsibius exemplaris TaxID=2072580 RepID=A0A1W0X6N1_HYPEX|nr:Homeobox protein onecut [Hypsibius exemplaris]
MEYSMYNVNAMNRNAAAYQTRSPVGYQNPGRCHWWLPVVPEMDVMAASDGIHDNGLNDSGGGGSDPLMSQASGHDLGGSRSPNNMTSSALCEGTDFRGGGNSAGMTNSSESAAANAATYGAFTGNNGRMSPSQYSGSSGSSGSGHGGGNNSSSNGNGGSSSYATLTPLQPLPPISSVSEKFSHNPVATPQGFHFITPNHQLSVHNITNTYQYATGPFAPLIQTNAGGYTGSASPFSPQNVHSSANGVSLTIQLPGGLAVQSNFLSQQALQESMENNNINNSNSHNDRSTPNHNSHGHSHHNHNQNSSSPNATPNSSPRQIVVDNSPTNSHHSHHSGQGGTDGTVGNMTTTTTTTTTGKSHRSGHHRQAYPASSHGKSNGGGSTTGGTAGATAATATTTTAAQDEMEEINTKELAQRISAELKRYSIPQAIFAQRVLCRSQGTLSDLLRNPKPWSKLKSGRETFRRMGKWLEEPEFQRMSALRLAGAWTPTPQNPSGAQTPAAVVPQVNFGYQENLSGPVTVCIKRVKQEDQLIQQQQQQQQHQQQQQQQHHQDSPEPNSQQQPKKPRLVFTDIQRKTLQQIFKETKRPNKEMQLAISNQLGLELSTVGNFFMNARRRSQDKWQDGGGGGDGGDEKLKKEGKSRVKKELRHVVEQDVKMEM